MERNNKSDRVSVVHHELWGLWCGSQRYLRQHTATSNTPTYTPATPTSEHIRTLKQCRIYTWIHSCCTECVIAVRFVAHIGQPYKVVATTRRLNIISCSIFVTAPCIIYIILWPCMGQKCIYIYIIIYNNNNNYTKCVYYMTFCIIPDTCINSFTISQASRNVQNLLYSIKLCNYGGTQEL